MRGFLKGGGGSEGMKDAKSDEEVSEGMKMILKGVFEGVRRW